MYNIETSQSKIGKSINSYNLWLSLNIDTKYNDWCKRHIVKNIYSEPEIDFYSILSKTNGRPRQDYVLTIDFAKKLCMASNSDYGESIRNMLVKLTNDKERGDLITHHEAVFAFQFVNYYRHIENQIEVEKKCLSTLAEQTGIVDDKKYGVSKKIRGNDTGFSREKVEAEYKDWCIIHHQKINKNLNMRQMMVHFNKYYLLRVAVYDFCKEKNIPEPKNMANIIVSIAEKLGIEIRQNKDDVFEQKYLLDAPTLTTEIHLALS
jgi:phage anti-repressor protein